MPSGLRTLTLLCVFASLLVITSSGTAVWAGRLGPLSSTKQTYALARPTSSSTTLAQDNEYISWAIGDTKVHPPQPRLMCPEGKFIKSVSIRQNEWLAHIKMFCASPNAAISTPTSKEEMVRAQQEATVREAQGEGNGTPGPEAGGDGGSQAHRTAINCPENYLVDGITGLKTGVSRWYGAENFAADPHFFCGAYNMPGAVVVSDSNFKRSGDSFVSYQEMNSLFPDPGIQARFHCPARWAANGMWYKLGGAKSDDIQTLGLICAPLPSPRATTKVARP